MPNYKETKPLAVIITGNPKYINDPDISQIAKSFYNLVETILINKGFDVEFDSGRSYTLPNVNALVWVAHSKGISRLKYAPTTIKTIALECEADDGMDHLHYILSDNDIKVLNNLQ